MVETPEKICTLSIDHAIRIAKIIATAPAERMPMITQLFSQASVDLQGLDELIENAFQASQNRLIDTDEFIHELIQGRDLTPKGYLLSPDEFNRFCLEKGLQPRLTKRYLYAKGYIEATQESSGKISYSTTVWNGNASQRKIVVKAQKAGDEANNPIP